LPPSHFRYWGIHFAGALTTPCGCTERISRSKREREDSPPACGLRHGNTEKTEDLENAQCCGHFAHGGPRSKFPQRLSKENPRGRSGQTRHARQSIRVDQCSSCFGVTSLGRSNAISSNDSRTGCGNFRCGTPQLKCPQHLDALHLQSSPRLGVSSEAGGESPRATGCGYASEMDTPVSIFVVRLHAVLPNPA
jgi:hypothetical protein